MGIVTYNGVTSNELGLIVQATPSYTYAEKNITFQHIVGRNGDLVINSKCYKNTTRTYYFAKVFRPGETYISTSKSITEWLHSANNYVRLEDTYEPDFYRMALYKDPGTYTNYYDQASAFEVTFECKPQKWLKIGDSPLDLDNLTITNPTNFDAMPIFELPVTANVDVNLYVNGTLAIKITGIESSDTIIIDCENMECYSNTKNYNNNVELTDMEFPILKGNTTFSFTITGSTGAKIKPRWWTL